MSQSNYRDHRDRSEWVCWARGDQSEQSLLTTTCATCRECEFDPLERLSVATWISLSTARPCTSYYSELATRTPRPCTSYSTRGGSGACHPTYAVGRIGSALREKSRRGSPGATSLIYFIFSFRYATTPALLYRHPPSWPSDVTPLNHYIVACRMRAKLSAKLEYPTHIASSHTHRLPGGSPAHLTRTCGSRVARYWAVVARHLHVT